MPATRVGVVPLPVPAGTLIRLASIRLFGFYRGPAPRTTATLRRAFLVQQQAREASLTMLQSNTKEVRGMMPASARLVLVGLVLLTAAPSSTSAVSKLPHYVTACSRSDPKINACVLKTGKHAIPFIINGDPKYRVPKLNPLVIPELELQQGSGPVGLRLSWKNAELHGLKDADFQEVDLNVKKMHLRMGFFLPKLSIIGTYSAKGRVLLLPVTGSGPSNITVQRMKISYDIDYKVVNRSNGREYLEVYNPKVTLHDIGFMSLKFENLFNGERRLGLGNELNVFLNENWKDLAKEFGPGVADAVGQVFQLILKNICDIVPYELVLKP